MIFSILLIAGAVLVIMFVTAGRQGTRSRSWSASDCSGSDTSWTFTGDGSDSSGNCGSDSGGGGGCDGGGGGGGGGH